MKRRLVIFALAICLILPCLFMLTACDDEAPHVHNFSEEWSTNSTHHWYACDGCNEKKDKVEHTFNQEVIDARYLKSVANCVSPAVYFKSCVCGEKGTETFVTGGIDSQVHDFDGGVYISTDGTHHWKKCSRCDAEDVTNKVAHDFTGAWVTDGTHHWKKCTCCDAEDVTNKAAHDFTGAWVTDGTDHWKECEACDKIQEKIAHTFDQEIQSAEYLKVAATCENKGEYYHSCSCGERGATTFETAVRAHSYVDGACSHCGATDGLVYSGGSVTGYTGTATNVVVPKYTNSGAVANVISDNCFKDNTNIVSVTLPESVQYIRMSAFKGCTNLQTINLENVREFSSSAFENCSSLNNISLDSATAMGQMCFKNCTSLESIVFPNQLTNIQMNGFYGCSRLASITFGTGLQQIGPYAFQDCTALTSVNLPNNITLGDKAFGNCSNLATANIPTGITEIGNFFRDCTALNNITIPAGVTTIGYEAFYGCSNLSDITFEEGSQLETIGSNAFAHTKLTSITLPNTVTSVGYRAFHMCNELRNVNFGTGLQTLGNEVFYNVNLTEITLPASLTSIPTVFMVSNSSLTTINYLGTQAQWNALEKGARWVSGLANYVVKTSDNQEGFAEGDYVNVYFYVGNDDVYYNRAVISETTVSAPTTAPTKEGFTFEGWFKATDSTGTSLSEVAYDFNTPITNNTYLFAKWSEVE